MKQKIDSSDATSSTSLVEESPNNIASSQHAEGNVGESAPPQVELSEEQTQELAKHLLALLGGEVSDEENDANEELAFNLFDYTGRPWQTSSPFKPYQNVGEFVEGTGQTMIFSSGILGLSAVATGISGVLAGCSLLALTLSPAIAAARGLFAGARTERAEDESFAKHAFNSVKQGVLTGVKSLFWTLAASAVSLVLAGVALLMSAALAVAAVATAVVGSAVQVSRLLGTAGSGIKNAVQQGMSLFTSKSDDIDDRAELIESSASTLSAS